MENKIQTQDISEILVSNYMPYAVSTIEDRAIVGIDGMKPVHRRILHSMMKDGLLKGNKVKSAKAVGNVLKYHPHGDSAVYETMVRLSQEDSMNIKLIDGKGNLGEHTSSELQPAHMRYTEVKLEPIVKDLFCDIEKLDFLMVSNFDESALEPSLLPTKFPHILTNMSMGIATGMGSNICGFNLEEVCNATIELMKNDNINISDFIKAPDFPTGGGLIYNEKTMRKIFKTGRGSIKLRAKLENNPETNCLIVKEIPYNTTREAIIDKIIELVKDKTLTEIVDINDLTGLNGMEIEIEYKKNTDVELLKNKLYKLTTLEDSFSCNFNILINGKPMVVGVKRILQEWIKSRTKCIRYSAKVDLENIEKDTNILLGYGLIIEDLDKVIEILRFSDNDEEMIDRLKKDFNLNDLQAQHIINMKFRSINNKYLSNKIKEIEELHKKKAIFEKKLQNNEAVYEQITEELIEIKRRYNKPRKTTILENIETITKEDLIPSYPVKLCLSKQGYFKKIKSNGYRVNGSYNLKDDDSLLTVIDSNNKGTVLMLTNKGSIIKKRVNDFEEVKMSQIGTFLNNIIDLESDEKVIRIASIEDFNEDMYICFQNGRIVKIPLKIYDTNRTKLINAYSLDSEIINIFTGTFKNILMTSSLNKVLIFSTDEIPSTQRKGSKGVICLKEKDNSTTTLCVPLEMIDTEEINIDYYRAKRNAIGKYLRKQEQIKLKK